MSGNTLNIIGSILGIGVSLMVIIPAVVRALLKPIIRAHTETIVEKMDGYIEKNDRRWRSHLNSGTHVPPPSDRRFDVNRSGPR